MDPHHLLHGHREHAEGVIVPQVLLGGEGQLLEVGQGADMFRFYSHLVHAPAIEVHQVVDPLHHRLQAFKLQGLQGLPGHGFVLHVSDHRVLSHLPIRHLPTITQNSRRDKDGFPLKYQDLPSYDSIYYSGREIDPVESEFLLRPIFSYGGERFRGSFVISCPHEWGARAQTTVAKFEN